VTDVENDGAALALAIARGDQEGAGLLLDSTADPFPVTWWCARALLDTAAGTDALPLAGERAWRAEVEHATAAVVIVSDPLLDAAEVEATETARTATRLLRAILNGDDDATRQLRRDVTDWRAPARYCATALVEALSEQGHDPAAVLAEFAGFHGKLDVLNRDIARRERELGIRPDDW
jgi:hypothetical protein